MIVLIQHRKFSTETFMCNDGDRILEIGRILKLQGTYYIQF